MNSCQSCGMPMDKPEDYGGGKVNNPYCKYCSDDQGNLLPKETVREKMIQFQMQSLGKTHEEAEKEVDQHMALMPAWKTTEGATEGGQLVGEATKTAEKIVGSSDPAASSGAPTTPGGPPLSTSPTEQSTPSSLVEKRTPEEGVLSGQPVSPPSQPTPPGDKPASVALSGESQAQTGQPVGEPSTPPDPGQPTPFAGPTPGLTEESSQPTSQPDQRGEADSTGGADSKRNPGSGV